jgi:hypothetical protein
MLLSSSVLLDSDEDGICLACTRGLITSEPSSLSSWSLISDNGSSHLLQKMTLLPFWRAQYFLNNHKNEEQSTQNRERKTKYPNATEITRIRQERQRRKKKRKTYKNMLYVFVLFLYFCIVNSSRNRCSVLQAWRNLKKGPCEKIRSFCFAGPCEPDVRQNFNIEINHFWIYLRKIEQTNRKISNKIFFCF